MARDGLARLALSSFLIQTMCGLRQMLLLVFFILQTVSDSPRRKSKEARPDQIRVSLWLQKV